MPTPCIERRAFLFAQLLLTTLTWLVWPSVTHTADYGNEVTVLIEPRQAVATSLLSGRRAIPLDAHETVIGSDANGINAIVVTSRRLLGFSSRTLAWSETDRDLNEKVLERRVLPTFSVVRTNKHLYGFRGANGVWLDEPLGVRETVKRTQTTDYGVVFVTNERLVGFASLLGDFSSKALGVHERVTRLDNEKGLIIFTTSTRTLVFGSRLSGWEEFE
ncbi:MAG: hypothetical protein SGJ26_12690 [Nitrospirota bacterium]|nr:hypothetical protein [Nitrospirota bacterium]